MHRLLLLWQQLWQGCCIIPASIGSLLLKPFVQR
jgi:hypothetical protein